jgi:predicted phosphoadenosine phosphosulfate sulfurtransferase
VVRRVARSFDGRAVAELEVFDASLTGCQVRIGSGAFYSRLSRLGYRIFGVPNGESPERIALVEKLDALTYARPTTVDLYMRVYAAMVRWYQARGFAELEESDAVGGIGSLLARERVRVEAIGAQHTVPFMRYAFSRLSTQELAQYLAQVEAPAGQWYAKAVREALIETIERRSQAIER